MTWSNEISPEKSMVIHLEKQKNPEDYFIAAKKIGLTEFERDFGYLVSSDDT